MTSASKEVRVAAAIKLNGKIWSIPKPARHSDVMWHMVENGVAPPIKGTQGFITNEDRFLNRTEANDLAILNGQFDKKRDIGLFSEDLW